MSRTSAERAPRTLTREEQVSALSATADRAEGYRDHVLISLALATGIREHEIAALDVSDVYHSNRGVRDRIRLRTFKGDGRDGAPSSQEVFASERLREKLSRFMSWKRRRGEPTSGDSPLFLSARKQRISTRTIRHLWREVQKRAGFADPLFTFHALRHTAIQNVYDATRDLRLAQRFARHADIQTTTIYAAPGDDRVRAAVDSLPC